MILSSKYLKSLIKQGKAQKAGIVYNSGMDCSYQSVSRLDKLRTDHYLIGKGDCRN
jgi:hypothetical protein